MKREKEEMYEAPCTRRTLVTLEEGVMKASIFHEENDQDEGVSIEGHEVGNTGDYTQEGFGWDQSSFN